jgi:transposase-like protein
VRARRDKDGWSCLLQDLRTRGATEVDLIGTSGHDGLFATVSSLFTATLRQGCLVHKQRNVLNAIAHRERKEVAAELAEIWKQEKKEDALPVEKQSAEKGGGEGGSVLQRLLCNRSTSLCFFLDDFWRSLLYISFPSDLLEVRLSSPFACLLIAPLYTKSGMVSEALRAEHLEQLSAQE